MDASNSVVISDQLEQRIATKTLTLPMLPQVTTQVISLVNNVDSDALALAKLIQSDQALAGHVMRIANSAAYSPNTKMTSLQQATARLGMQNIAEIAMTASMGPSMFAAKGYEDLIKDIWQSSLATAVWAREIARQCRRNVESTFLCGLLFQIGRPVILQTVLEIAKSTNTDIQPEEMNRLMDNFQAQAGVVLSDHWQLPEAVKHTIDALNDDSVANDSHEIASAVKAAKVFALCTTADRNYDLDTLSTNNHIVELNLYVEDVQQLLEKADAVHETMSALTV